MFKKRALRRADKRKIGIALGSGGAKGFAHLGMLQAMYENGIEFDVYAGASAGSIVGALCACGYSPSDALELMARIEYKKTAVDVVVRGTNETAFLLLNEVFGGRDFSELVKPFCATATDSANGTTVYLQSGNVAKAVLASSSVPPLFKGVQYDNKVLIDGAYSNAVPGDAARRLGADLVIGVSLAPIEQYETRDFITSNGNSIVVNQNGFKDCDLILQPDLTVYRTTDVLSTAKMYDIGYACATEHMTEIVRLVQG